ncbi:Interferon-induced guanylate-binding protein 1 [Tetrabaena socialis]|uniref:Interferon-induced guanylate-binding protein 1 n=1 Tax=Tetrabaena socialis TaxID=47790 RepID=A0A2J8AEQ1_9CHLO|nr:Interferon-induced guanylate-binding protein 1 [Tetrabaena socialis]|eukprot:PNH10976.1 Interferon-induced guanylate-binding protein 1 [Tetrabaena socialis]
MGTPLELIKYNGDNGKFEIGTSALDALRKVKGPVAVVAVSGRARQGKSFILNQLLLQSSGGGFQVGATHRPCTKGLWMWSSPQRMTAADGSTHHLVLLDTEGIDAYDQTAQYSTQIFSLAVLLSSLFVYNQMGGIDESALDRLSLVTEMTKHVRVRTAAANNGAGPEEGLGEHSPGFLWLLRDFYLQLEEEGGRKITPREYLETALRPVGGVGPAVASKNAIRASIAQLFPARDCFTLVRPMHDEVALSQMDTLPRDKLRPEFQKGVKDLTSLIFQRAQPKRFGSQLMTGPVLAGLVGAYVGAINGGAVPTIATAWQGVAESECRRGCDAAEAAYAAAWAAGGDAPAEEAALEARNQQALAAANAAYEDVAVGDEVIRKAHEARWRAAVAGRYKDLRGRRLAEAAAAVNELLYKGATAIAQAARGGADLAVLQQHISGFVASYDKAAAGPTKWQKLAAFLAETWPAAAAQVLDRQAAAARAALEAAQREAAEQRNLLAAEKQRAEQAERLHRDASTAVTSLQQQLAAERQRAEQAERLHRDASGAVTSLQQQLAAERQRAEQGERLHRDVSGTATSLQQQLAELQAEASRLRASLDQKSARAAALEAQMTDVLTVSERKQANAGELAEARVRAAEAEQQAKVSEMTAVLTAERARADGLAADLDSLGARCSGAEARVAALEVDAGDWRSKYSREAAARLDLQGQRDQARDSLALVAVERDSVTRERDAARAELQQLRGDLQAEAGAKGAMQARLDELVAEAQAARAQALGVGASQHRTGNDENLNPSADDGGHAASGGRVLVEAGNIASMTVQEIKDALTQAGLTEEVWTLTNRKPAPKKADWVDLLRRRAA